MPRHSKAAVSVLLLNIAEPKTTEQDAGPTTQLLQLVVIRRRCSSDCESSMCHVTVFLLCFMTVVIVQ